MPRRLERRNSFGGFDFNSGPPVSTFSGRGPEPARTGTSQFQGNARRVNEEQGGMQNFTMQALQALLEQAGMRPPAQQQPPSGQSAGVYQESQGFQQTGPNQYYHPNFSAPKRRVFSARRGGTIGPGDQAEVHEGEEVVVNPDGTTTIIPKGRRTREAKHRAIIEEVDKRVRGGLAPERPIAEPSGKPQLLPDTAPVKPSSRRARRQKITLGQPDEQGIVPIPTNIGDGQPVPIPTDVGTGEPTPAAADSLQQFVQDYPLASYKDGKFNAGPHRDELGDSFQSPANVGDRFAADPQKPVPLAGRTSRAAQRAQRRTGPTVPEQVETEFQSRQAGREQQIAGEERAADAESRLSQSQLSGAQPAPGAGGILQQLEEGSIDLNSLRGQDVPPSIQREIIARGAEFAAKRRAFVAAQQQQEFGQVDPATLKSAQDKIDATKGTGQPFDHPERVARRGRAASHRAERDAIRVGRLQESGMISEGFEGTHKEAVNQIVMKRSQNRNEARKLGMTERQFEAHKVQQAERNRLIGAEEIKAQAALIAAASGGGVNQKDYAKTITDLMKDGAHSFEEAQGIADQIYGTGGGGAGDTGAGGGDQGLQITEPTESGNIPKDSQLRQRYETSFSSMKPLVDELVGLRTNLGGSDLVGKKFAKGAIRLLGKLQRERPDFREEMALSILLQLKDTEGFSGATSFHRSGGAVRQLMKILGKMADGKKMTKEDLNVLGALSGE